MKKAKIMLLTIAIGGALAFKATKFNGTVWLCTATFNSPLVKVCTQPGYEITINRGFPSTVYNSTTATFGTCPHVIPGSPTIYCINSVVTFITDNFGE